jgi:hypothetical protein
MGSEGMQIATSVEASAFLNFNPKLAHWTFAMTLLFTISEVTDWDTIGWTFSYDTDPMEL